MICISIHTVTLSALKSISNHLNIGQPMDILLTEKTLSESIPYLNELAKELSFFLELKILTFQRSVQEHNALSDST